MEAVSCLKSLVSAASQFRNSSGDENLVHLLRQLDVSTACQLLQSFFSKYCFENTLCLFFTECRTVSSLLVCVYW